MDPNNNQPINTNPLGQKAPEQPNTVASPAAPAPVQPAVPTVNQAVEQPKNNKKMLVLLIILVLLILGMGSYVLFAQNRLTNSQKTSGENMDAVIPVITPTPTPATVDEVEIQNPDIGLSEIEKDIQEL